MKTLFPVSVFSAVYIIMSGIIAALTGNAEFVFYLFIMLVLIGFILLVHSRVRFPIAILWCLSIWGLLHMMGGMFPIPEDTVLYNLWLIPGILKYDQLVHAYGFGITTWVCWECLRSHISHYKKDRIIPTVGTLSFCILASMGFGALNEVIEFIATYIIPETNVGDYQNIGWDLVYNLIGAVLVAFVIRWKFHTNKDDLIPAYFVSHSPKRSKILD